jgi:hypothetical protein
MTTTTLDFHNNTVQINQLWFSSHKTLIMNLCIELKMVDKIEELTNKFLGPQMKIKKRKDEKAPKRAKSAFLFYCDEMRPKLISKVRAKKQPVKIGNIAKELGIMWGKLTEAKKNKYKDMNTKDKERYIVAIEKYNEGKLM